MDRLARLLLHATRNPPADKPSLIGQGLNKDFDVEELLKYVLRHGEPDIHFQADPLAILVRGTEYRVVVGADATVVWYGLTSAPEGQLS